jgi:hypothetical protein
VRTVSELILSINSGSNGRSPGPGADMVCNGGGPRSDLGEAIVVRGRAECGRVLLVGRCKKRPPHGGGPGAAR